MGREPLLRRLAREVLGEGVAERVWKRIEVIGDIAVIRKPFDLDASALKPLAERLLQELSYVRSVWVAVTPVSGEHRVREYVHLAGERRSETVYREHGCSFVLDITRVYVSPVLSYDHARVARMVRAGERVLNMFAGIGGYSIVVSRLAKPSYVLSIDINPHAARYARVNAEINGVASVNEVVEGDALLIAEGLRREFDRVLLPLPELWREALRKAVKVVRVGGWIHPHLFVSASRKREAMEVAKVEVLKELASLGIGAEVVGGHVIRSVGPRKYHVTLDVRVTRLAS